MTKTPEFRISGIYRTLFDHWGVQSWWPAETPFEVIIGAILVQNTAWTNAAKALHSLRNAGALSLEGVRETPLSELERLVRSSGFFRQKAARLKAFVEWLDQSYEGSLEQMFRQPTEKLRADLLELKGIGRETADSILLYAAQHEIFVVDAYTRRVFERHDLVAPSASYDDVRLLVERALIEKPELLSQSGKREVTVKLLPGLGHRKVAVTEPSITIHEPSTMSRRPRSAAAQAFNEMHALLVQVGKHYCHRSQALCQECPLRFDLSKVGGGSE